MIKERPILFSGAMVRAILEGRKTVTRRAINPQPFIDASGNFCWNGRNYGQTFEGPRSSALASPIPCSKTKRVACPYGKPGDQLWVRETCFINGPDKGAEVIYKADPLPNWEGEEADIRWRPSIHMPRWASRIQLEITAARVERLQDIIEEQAKAEGATCELAEIDSVRLGAASTYRAGFQRLWQSINGPESWDANPWVWVVEFHRIDHQEQINEN